MLKNIRNETIDTLQFEENLREDIKDIFIFSIGYEERSLALLSGHFINKCPLNIGLLFDDYKKYPIAKKNREFVLKNSIVPETVSYSNYDAVVNIINKTVKHAKESNKVINLHVDYSSMPRSWYCRLAINAKNFLGPKDRIYFWYSQGEYSNEIESWPNAGIQDFTVFSGRASLRPNNNRSHILGVGFDHARASAICSVLDPSYLVVTYSHAQEDSAMRSKIKNLNQRLNCLSAYSVTLPVDDFKFSCSKLYETVKELLPNGDVILVPDGPKTQILTASLMPSLFDGSGVICLHVKRHCSSYAAINIKPNGKVSGFSYGQST